MSTKQVPFAYSERCIHPMLIDADDPDKLFKVCTYCWELVDPYGYAYLALDNDIIDVDLPRVPIELGEIVLPFTFEVPQGAVFNNIMVVWDHRFQRSELPTEHFFNAGEYTILSWGVRIPVEGRGSNHREYWRELPD